MWDLRIIALPVVALLGGLALPPGASSAQTPVTTLYNGGQPVTVIVGFNTEIPIKESDETKLAATQKAGREHVYLLGREECTLLLATIAETCRLTSLNVSTNIRPQYYSGGVPLLNIDGNAELTITLKGETASGE